MSRTLPQRLRLAATAAGVSLALIMTGTPVVAAPAAAPALGPSSAAVVGQDEAAAKAAATGKAVAVTGATTATSTLTANPNGSFTWTQTAQPVRKLVAGTWTDLDATLTAGADGYLRPRVATGDLRLSGGGTGPLATMAGGGRSLALTLPFRLPAPTVAGPTATYAAVLPGVDLKVTANDQGGFSEVLVVADAAAAANPQVAALTMTTAAAGLTLSADAAGNIIGTDVNHRAVVTAPAPTMWDSAQPAGAAATVTEPATGRKLSAKSGVAATSTDAGPGVAAHVAPLGVSLVGDKLTLTPSQSLLASATWPVYIDPAWSWGASTNGWAVIGDGDKTKKYWKDSPSDQNDMQSGKDLVTGEVRRLLLNFAVDTSRLTKDVIISDATLNITETWSYNCTASKVDIYAPTSVVTATNAYWNAWANVNLGTRNDQLNVAYGHDSGCPNHGVGFDITTGMKAAATGGRKNQTFVIKANDEDAGTGWKRWSASSPTITVTYDHKPNTPSALHTSPTTACTGSTVGDANVKLYATVSDPDGGTLSANFAVWKTSNSAVKQTATLTNIGSGTGNTPYTVAKTWMETNSGGVPTSFSWNLTTTQNSLTSSTSATCSFTFDPTRQHAAEISQAPAATIGSPASFTISYIKNAGETVVPASYQYQVNAGPITTVTADATGTATITVTPRRTVNRLTVVSVSAGANFGGSAEQIFAAGLPAPAADADLNGDGNADLVTVGGVNSIPSGAWLATGSGTGTAPAVTTAATNIGNNGTGVNVAGSPADFDGHQLITGRFTGTNLQDMLYYNPVTGGGGILGGNNAGEPIFPADDNLETINAGMLTDYSAVNMYEDQPLILANAGKSSGQTTGFMDLIATSGDATDGYHLVYYPNVGAPAGFPMGLQLTTPAPDGTMAWNAWTITTAQRADDTTDMFLWNKSTGALWLWAGLAFTDDGSGNPVLTYTASVLADGSTTTFQKAAAVSLRAADINKDGTADLWTVGAGRTVTAWLVTAVAGGTGTITAQPAQTLSTPTHSWLLNDATEGRATTARDYAGNLTATATTGNPSFTTGDLYSPDVTFTAAGPDRMSTASAAVDTNADFTISLWTKPTTYSGNVLSQDGANGTLFKIWPSSDTTWKFAFQKSDVVFASATWDTASSAAGTAKLGFWYHITATYQASTKRMQLYVNDVPAGSAIRSSTWTYAGTKLQLGGMKVGASTWDWHYDGQLTNVQTWNAVVPPILLANWDMGGGSGTTITDQSGFGNTATLAGGYTWNTTGHNAGQNGSVTFNGTTGYAQINQALVQPATGSFSVAAWVYLTDTTGSTDRAFLSQPGVNRAPFYLLYGMNTNSWQFLFSAADVPTNPVLYVAADPTPAARNTWVHVAGTYDAPTHTARLYVNGNLVATTTGISTWNSTGKTFIGRSGATWWQGKIDAARVYQGALTADQIKDVMITS